MMGISIGLVSVLLVSTARRQAMLCFIAVPRVDVPSVAAKSRRGRYRKHRRLAPIRSAVVGSTKLLGGQVGQLQERNDAAPAGVVALEHRFTPKYLRGIKSRPGRERKHRRLAPIRSVVVGSTKLLGGQVGQLQE